MHIEAVSVCVGYADFLSETAKHNVGVLDTWTIVTEPGDTETREICRKKNLKMILSDDGSRFGKPFGKGRLVERGLQHLSANGWRLHLDADIVLPHDFRHRLLAADLQEDMIYGVDRVLATSWGHWQKIKHSGYVHGEQYGYHCQTQFMKDAAIGSRWAHPQFGYCPIGFFQLWHSSQDESKGIRVKPYPMNHGNACRTDVQHALQWDRHKRAIIPELIVVHLESEPVPKGANWNGRITRPFGPPTPQTSEAGRCGECGDGGYHRPEHHHHKHHRHEHHGKKHHHHGWRINETAKKETK